LLFPLIKQSDAIIAPRLRPRQSRDDQLSVAEDSSAEAPSLSASNNSPSLEEVLIRTVEQSLPSLESSNPYERFMRLLLQHANDPSFDINSLFRNTAIQQAFNRGGTQAERTSTTGHLYQQSSSSPSQMPDQQSLVPSLGSLARGVITQTGNQMPFMSEVISNIMRNNGINGAMSPQVDVILEYGEGGSQSGINHIQPQLIDLPAGGVSEQRGHPTAIGYHVEVHQFDVIPQPMGPDSSQISSQHSISLNTYAPSTSSNYSNLPNTSGSTSTRSGFVQGGQRQLGPANNLPLFIGNTGFQPEMHVTPPRQEVGLNSSGDILVNDEENFRVFIQLAVRSALSQMVHADQDRNARASNEQRIDSFLREDGSRNILMEMANAMTLGFESRLITILDTSGAPSSLLRPGNALLLNFATLGDLASMLDFNMTPLEFHRARFRAHVIENQLNGNSTPTDDDLLSASERLAALHSSIASVICTAGGEVERIWNGRLLSIPQTIRNVEIATIQQLLRSLLNRTISDAEFSRRIQNTLRDYVRHLVALGNYSFSNAEQTAYITIVFELLVNADRSIGHTDTNLTRLLHLRRFVLPRIAVLLRAQAWTVVDDCLRPDVSSISDVQSLGVDHQVCNAVHNGVNEDYEDSHDETRSRGTPSIGPAAAKKRKLEDEEPKPSTSHGCFEMSSVARTGTEEDAQSAAAQLRGYDGDWARSFPDWVETMECDALSGQTNPRLLRNPSDMYQMGHLEHGRRQVVPEHASEESLLSSAAQEIVGNVFRGNIPTTIHENISSGAALSALDELMDLAIQNRIQGDSDYDPTQYPNVAWQFHKNHELL
uniref:BAG6 domain-containing protein n=1 Tax=Angiostrongylus cantonensis TaxID=6313 RepID=A0A0K0DNL1_ANGCA